MKYSFTAIFCLLVCGLLAFSSVPALAASIEVYGGGGGGGGGGGKIVGSLAGVSSGGDGGLGGDGVQGYAGGDGGPGAPSFTDPCAGGGGGGTTGAGGNGQNDGSGGLPGPGGNATAGQGSGGGGGGAGGDGSDGIDQNNTLPSTVADSITVIAGNGGNGGQNFIGGWGAGGDGGAGGAAGLTLSGATVTSTGPVLVQSGANGLTGSGFGPDNGAGGAGGAASLTVNTLTAPSVTAWKRDGTLSVNISTLDVTGSDTALTATGTATADFQITSANLSGGHLMSINNSAGDMTIGNLNIAAGQSGRLFVADGARQSITNLNAAGADLTFVLPAGVVADQTIVKVNTADISGTTIGVDDGNGRISMTGGQSVKLIAASAGIIGQAANLTVQTANGDIFDLQVSGNDLLLILQQISPNTPAYERLKAYAEGRTATLAFVNQGADLVLNQGMGSALGATSGTGFKFAPFAAGSGGWSRYNTGSHVDVSGASMLAGLAVGNDAGPGRITAGAFFEGGWGNYNSYNSFSNYSSVEGDGDTDYYGGGIMGRYDLKRGALSGLYFDASARMGRSSADFGSSDIKYNGSKADFDTAAMYWGAHAGLGYQWSFTEKAMLDVSGKFIWTRQDGDTVNVQGDKVDFDSADSLRTRLGGRFNYAVCDYATPYVGAYWEHEFDGKQRSSVNGVDIGSPDLKGDTGVGELGLTIKPVKNSGFSMDLGVQGYTGVREGVSGSLQLKLEF